DQPDGGARRARPGSAQRARRAHPADGTAHSHRRGRPAPRPGGDQRDPEVRRPTRDPSHAPGGRAIRRVRCKESASMRPDAPADTLVGAYVNALLNACATTLSTITQVPITLELELPLREPSEPLADTLPLPWFVAYARFTRGLTGVHQLVLAQRD